MRKRVCQSKNPNYCNGEGNLFWLLMLKRSQTADFCRSFFSFCHLPFSKGSFPLLPRRPRCKEDAVGSYALTWQWLFQPVYVVSVPREEETGAWP